MTAIAASVGRVRAAYLFGVPRLRGSNSPTGLGDPGAAGRGAGCAGRLLDPPEGGTPNGPRPPHCPGRESKAPAPTRTNGHAPAEQCLCRFPGMQDCCGRGCSCVSRASRPRIAGKMPATRTVPTLCRASGGRNSFTDTALTGGCGDAESCVSTPDRVQGRTTTAPTRGRRRSLRSHKRRCSPAASEGPEPCGSPR